MPDAAGSPPPTSPARPARRRCCPTAPAAWRGCWSAWRPARRCGRWPCCPTPCPKAATASTPSPMRAPRAAWRSAGRSPATPSPATRRHGARFRAIIGDDLLAENYPMIHAVGRASARAPRLADFTWGDAAAPKLTLVGKGVCFDSGGLDLKTSGGMRLMKKDMGGAATVLGLAEAIMAARLPVRLRVLVPAVENFVSANALRPLDVIRTRKGITVEIG